MRPTPSEELDAARHILSTIVLPATDDAFLREKLGHVIATLERASAGWDVTGARLVRENAAYESVLRDVLARARPDLAARISNALSTPTPADSSFEAINARYAVLRGLISEAIREALADGYDDVVATIATALRANLERVLAPAPPAR